VGLNQEKIVKRSSVLIAAGAVVVMAVLPVALNEEKTVTGTGTVGTEAGGMSLGATATTTTPPTALPDPVAHPTMKAAVPKGFR
jgi:hypothetical protein